MKRYSKNGIDYSEQEPSEGFEVIESYTPHSCPWDCYGNKFLAEYGKMLEAVGIHCEKLRTHMTIQNPYPSGPNGSVRFGDDMLPGEYRVAVPKKDVERAKEAIQTHKEAIRKWLDNKGAMPEACKGY